MSWPEAQELKDTLERRTELLRETQQSLRQVREVIIAYLRFIARASGENLKEAESLLGRMHPDTPDKDYLYQLRERIKDEIGLIPRNLDEAVPLLNDMLSAEDREFLQKSKNPDEVASRLHHSLGRYLRNEWRLWHGSPIAEHLKLEHGIEHPDDMSHHILLHYARVWIPTWHQHILEDRAIDDL